MKNHREGIMGEEPWERIHGEQSGNTWKPLRRHSGGTQETPRSHPEAARRHPEATKGTQETRRRRSVGIQEPPRRRQDAPKRHPEETKEAP